MKTLKSKVLALAIVALGMTVGITACKKDDNKVYSTENLNGTFVGTHFFDNVPKAILDLLSDGLPADTLEDGTVVPVSLNDGFDDTLSVSIDDGKLILHSKLLNIDVDGKIEANNTFSIKQHSYKELSLGTAISAKNAKIRSSKDISIKSNEPGTEVDVRLELSTTEVGGVSLPAITIITKGKFIKQ